MRWLAVVLAVLLSACTGATQAPQAPAPDQELLTFTVSPRIYFQPRKVQALLRIHDPERKWPGPLITIEWGDGSVSTIQSDVDPDSTEDVTIRRWQLIKACGEINVIARIESGVNKRVIAATVSAVCP